MEEREISQRREIDSFWKQTAAWLSWLGPPYVGLLIPPHHFDVAQCKQSMSNAIVLLTLICEICTVPCYKELFPPARSFDPRL